MGAKNSSKFIVFSLGLDDIDFDDALNDRLKSLSLTDCNILHPCMVATAKALMAEMDRYQGWELIFTYVASDNIYLVVKNEGIAYHNTGWCLTTMVGYGTRTINQYLKDQIQMRYSVYGNEPDNLYKVYEKAMNTGTYFTGRYDFCNANRACADMEVEQGLQRDVYNMYFQEDVGTFNLNDEHHYAEYGWFYTPKVCLKYFDVTKDSFEDKEFVLKVKNCC